MRHALTRSDVNWTLLVAATRGIVVLPPGRGMRVLGVVGERIFAMIVLHKLLVVGEGCVYRGLREETGQIRLFRQIRVKFRDASHWKIKSESPTEREPKF